MCLLVVCKPGSVPKHDDLHRGACANPHGYGFAMVINGKIFRYRTMSRKKAVNKFLEIRSQNPDGYAIWHARYATHGVKNEDNCHPFQVGSDEDTVLAHNGVLDTHIEEKDKRSDTRIFAEDTLPKLGGVAALDDENLWLLVEGWASGSKIAVLTVNPTAKHQLYLVNERLGEWDDDGVWWSNKSYQAEDKKYGRYTSTYSSYTTVGTPDYGSFYLKDNDDLATMPCPNCMIESTWEREWCEHCNLCYDCSSPEQSCMCYIPAQYRPYEIGY